MKKMGMACVLALAVTALCQQRASAWGDFKLSVGATLSWTGGGNSFGWGLWQGGPWPGVSCDPNCATGRRCGFGGCQYGYTIPGNWTAPAPAPAPAPQAGGSKETTALYNYINAYQTVGYNMPAYQPADYSAQGYQPYSYGYGYGYAGYPSANYYYPGYYNVPSYWYGGR
jgi:hypothetical protein